MPLPLIIAGATAAYNIINGIVQKNKAKKLAEQNQRPTEVVPDEVKENTAIAKDLATQGLPAAQYSRAQQEIEKSASAAVSASTDRRGGLAAVGQIQANTDSAKNNLVAEDAAARVSNIKNLMSRNDITAQWKDKIWDYNERGKYEENAAAIRALAGAGAANINTGIEMGASTLVGALDKGGTDQGSAAKKIIGMMGKKGSNSAGTDQLTPEQLQQIAQIIGSHKL